jgi:hypothetical protein
LAQQKATDLSKAVAEETFGYAQTILAELKAFEESDAEGAFVPSLWDQNVLPHYSFSEVGGIGFATYAKANTGVRATIKRGMTAPLSYSTDSKTFEFSSSNDEIASVSDDGRVTAKKIGTVLITLHTTDGTDIKSVIAVSVIP